MSTPELDPRFEWIAVTDMGHAEPTAYIQGPCRHMEMEKARVVEGAVSVFQCRTCGTVFPVIQVITNTDGIAAGYLVEGPYGQVTEMTDDHTG